MTIYMRIDGMQGDVTAKGHAGWIQLIDIQFQVKRYINAQPGRVVDREGTRPELSEILVRKYMDRTTPLIFSEACVGKAKSNITIELCTTNQALQAYMQYHLSNAVISAYEVMCDPAKLSVYKSQFPIEQVNLSFDKLEMKFTPYDQAHNPESPIPAAYDLKQAMMI